MEIRIICIIHMVLINNLNNIIIIRSINLLILHKVKHKRYSIPYKLKYQKGL